MPRFRNRPFLSHGPLLFVIPSAAERICGSPLVGPAPTGLQPSHPPNPPGNINLPFVIPGFQQYSVEPQIRSAALGMTKRRGPWESKGRLLDERAVAEPRTLSEIQFGQQTIYIQPELYSAKRASKQSTSYILKKPVAPLSWTALKFSRPCGIQFVNPGSHTPVLAREVPFSTGLRFFFSILIEAAEGWDFAWKQIFSILFSR